MAAALRTQTTAIGATNGGNTDIVLALTGVQAGDTLSVCVRERDGATVTGVSDTVNGSWTLSKTKTPVTGTIYIGALQNSGAGDPTITVVISGAGRVCDGNGSAWSGVVTTGGFDVTGEASNSAGTSHVNGSLTPSAAALILAAYAFSNDAGAISGLDAGYTALNRATGSGTTGRQSYLYKVTHTGATTAPVTSANSVSSDAVDVALLEAAGGEPPTSGPALGRRVASWFWR